LHVAITHRLLNSSVGHALIQMSFNSLVNSVTASCEFDSIHYLRQM